MSEYLHMDGVIELTKLSKPTINKYIKEKGFPKPTKIGSRNWWYKSQVTNWIDKQMEIGSKEQPE